MDSQDNQEEKLPKELLELKLKQKSFIDELMNLKNVREIDLPIKINAELRSYQTDGIKWLSFLNRYKLHGILCDDMGLGKTLQVCTILISRFFLLLHSGPENFKKSRPKKTHEIK